MNAGPALRDILLPPPPGGWPPAPGWWLLALALAAALVWFGRALWRRWRRRRRRQLVLAEFEAAAGAGDPAQRLARVSTLLRRVVRRAAPGAVALAGEPWLRFLDGSDPQQPFSRGAGRVLAEGPYRARLDNETLAAALPPIRSRLRVLIEEAGDA